MIFFVDARGSFARRLKLRRWTREVAPTLSLALPIVAGMISQMAIGIADSVMVGRLGVVPLAAASFVNSIAHLPFVFSLGVLSAIAILTSQAFGAGQFNQAGELLRHGLALSAAIGVGAAAVLAAVHPFLDWFGQPPEVVAAAGTYLLLFAASLAPALFVHGAKQFSEAVNQPWIPALVLLGGVGLNVGLNWILIYGHCGAPALGLEGAGWATLIARTVMAVCLLVHMVRSRSLCRFQPERWLSPLQRACFRRLLALGGPVAAQHLLEITAFALAGIMAGWINAESIAAHQIALTCASTSFMFALGLGMATCIRVGQSLGSRQYARMGRIGFGAVGIAVLIMGMFGVLFTLAGRPIARLFVSDPRVVILAGELLFITALFQIADATQVVSASALRGLADVRVPILISGLAYWLIALPLAYVLAFSGKQGVVGIWIGLAAGLGAAALALAYRFYRQTVRGHSWCER